MFELKSTKEILNVDPTVCHYVTESWTGSGYTILNFMTLSTVGSVILLLHGRATRAVILSAMDKGFLVLAGGQKD